VLEDELTRGRVALDDRGRYRLVATAFSDEDLSALRVLGP
jgi:hypothetical protein